jgi:hypothetical protein
VQSGIIGEMVRLNTSIPAVPAAQQKRLGVLEQDTAGFPNGRRPGDDVVDVALRVVMGVLLPDADAPSGKLPFTDGAYLDATRFPEKFPYLNTPIISSPLEPEITITLQSAAQVQGPYRSIPATYDSAARKLTGAEPDPNTGFYRLKTNGKVSLDSVKVQGTNVQIGVK